MAYEVVTQRQFDMLIAVYIIFNIVVMGSETFKMSSTQSRLINCADYVFNFVFGTEIIVKTFALYGKHYFSSNWNRFDFAVSMISFIGKAAELLSRVIPMSPTSARVFRIFRLFR